MTDRCVCAFADVSPYDATVCAYCGGVLDRRDRDDVVCDCPGPRRYAPTEPHRFFDVPQCAQCGRPFEGTLTPRTAA